MDNTNLCPVETIIPHETDLKFELTSVNDFETLYYLQKFTRQKFSIKDNLITALMLVLTIGFFLTGYIIPAFFTCVIFYVKLSKILSLKRAVRNHYNAFPDMEYTFSFYDDFFIVKTELGASCIPYDKINSFYEIDNYLIIHISASVNYIIKKNNFNFKSSELAGFIKEKIK